MLVTHDPDVAGVLPRTVTIRDGRIGGEGRSGEEYAVVTADGFLPLPGHARERLPPGTLVRLPPRSATTTSSGAEDAMSELARPDVERRGTATWSPSSRWT